MSFSFQVFAFKYIIFFLCSHLTARGAQLISQRVTTEIKLLLHNTFSECLIVIPTTNFHILTQRWLNVYSFMATESPTKFVCARLENSTLLGATRSTGNNKDMVSCLSILTECRSKHEFNAMESKPLTSKCQSSSVFDDDNPEEAKVEKPVALVLFLNVNKRKK
jgi:hypothetical protein